MSTFEEAIAMHQHKQSCADRTKQRRPIIREDRCDLRRSSGATRLIELEHCMEMWSNGPITRRAQDRQAEKYSQLCEATVDHPATLGAEGAASNEDAHSPPSSARGTATRARHLSGLGKTR